MTERRAIFELIFAAALWGLGFVAAILALRHFSPAEVLFLRFSLATAIGFGLNRFVLPKASFRKGSKQDPAIAGFILGMYLLLQTAGLQYTTATKSGFITCLYIVFVPLFLKRMNIKYATCLLVSLVGLWALTGADFSQMNRGDLLTLGCAVIGALHILWLDRKNKTMLSPWQYNNWQSLFALLTITPLLFLQNTPSQALVTSMNNANLPSTFYLSLLGIFILAAGCSVLAFFIQVRAQTVLAPTTASMIFLLESPFALLFGFLFLQEHLSWMGFVGAILIFASSLVSLRFTPH